ncbi:hypothetical protein D3C86_1455900 [compost metagenome]
MIGQRRAHERQHLLIGKQLPKLIGLIEPAECRLAFFLILDIQRFAIGGGSGRPFGTQMFGKNLDHGFGGRKPLADQILHAAFKIDAGLFKRLDCFGRGEFGKEVFEVVGRLVVRTGAPAGDLQGRADFGNGALARDAQCGKLGRQLG